MSALVCHGTFHSPYSNGVGLLQLITPPVKLEFLVMTLQ